MCREIFEIISMETWHASETKIMFSIVDHTQEQDKLSDIEQQPRSDRSATANKAIHCLKWEGAQNQREHHLIKTKYEMVHPTPVLQIIPHHGCKNKTNHPMSNDSHHLAIANKTRYLRKRGVQKLRWYHVILTKYVTVYRTVASVVNVLWKSSKFGKKAKRGCKVKFCNTITS